MPLRHVVLGGTGVVGRETIAALRSANHDVTGVRRESEHASSDGAFLGADLRDRKAAARALHGADVAYLVLGLPYRLSVWRRDLPTIVDNVIAAATAEGTHLVYFDNVYAYGMTDSPMTEDSPIRPSSRKGEVRAHMLDRLDSARESGLAVTVARSADFYGPGASTGVFNSMCIDSVAKGKNPTWLINSTLPHSMTYTPDIGASLAVLGTDDRARGKVWHLPTAPPLTGEEYMTIATGMNVRHRTMTLNTMRLGALFSPIAREALEMSYQNSLPYLFDSTRFESTFLTAPTPYGTGITRSLEAARNALSDNNR